MTNGIQLDLMEREDRRKMMNSNTKGYLNKTDQQAKQNYWNTRCEDIEDLYRKNMICSICTKGKVSRQQL